MQFNNNAAQAYGSCLPKGIGECSGQMSKEQAEKLNWANQQAGLQGVGSIQPSPPTTLLYDTCDRLAISTGKIHDLGDRLTKVAERVFGARPESAGGAPTPPINCEAGRLAYLLDCLGEACNRLDAQLQRIEQI